MTTTTLRPTHWRIAIALGCAGAIAVLLLFPYLFALMPKLRTQISIPLPAFVAAQVAQGAVMLTLLAWVGLRLGWEFRLDAPHLRHWLYAGPASATRWPLAIGLGAAVGTVCVAALLMQPIQMNGPDWWQGLLASFYGGIAEEIECRLFLVALLVWAAARVLRIPQPGPRTYWNAIIAAALLFGVGHLPALAQAGTFDTFNIARVVLLNALCGATFGWLFWKYGLEHAMAAHFSADLILHVAAPLLA
jgi:hypothetical protein